MHGGAEAGGRGGKESCWCSEALQGDKGALGEDDREKVGQCCMAVLQMCEIPGTAPYEVKCKTLNLIKPLLLDT